MGEQYGIDELRRAIFRRRLLGQARCEAEHTAGGLARQCQLPDGHTERHEALTSFGKLCFGKPMVRRVRVEMREGIPTFVPVNEPQVSA